MASLIHIRTERGNFDSLSLNIFICFTLELPKVVGIFPLNKKARGKDIGPLKNRPGVLVKVRPSPGPNNQPEGAIKLVKDTSYIQFPNGGKLDTKNAITVITWIRPDAPGKFLEYQPKGVSFGIGSGETLYARFVRRNGQAAKIIKTKRRVIPMRKWSYIAFTYDQRSGDAVIWRNSLPIAFQNLGWIRLATRNSMRIQGITGSISCLQIYQDALTGPQIKSVQNVCFGTGKLIPEQIREYPEVTSSVCKRLEELRDIADEKNSLNISMWFFKFRVLFLKMLTAALILTQLTEDSCR